LTDSPWNVDDASVGKAFLNAHMHPEILRKLHSFTGLLPLGAYLLFHAYEQFAARGGRTQAVLRLERTTSAPLEVLCVLLPLLLHAALGVRLLRLQGALARGTARFDGLLARGTARFDSAAVPSVREDASFPYASASFRSLQLWSGIVSAAFLLWHVAGVWVPRVVAERPAAGYGAMVDHAATVVRAALYVIGTTAVCVHFGQGLSAVCLRYQILSITPRAARVSCGLLAILLWLTFVDELSAYVGGRALL
jgi:succinate dehydrogenase / fumarate reductase cytochrome b subunit